MTVDVARSPLALCRFLFALGLAETEPAPVLLGALFFISTCLLLTGSAQVDDLTAHPGSLPFPIQAGEIIFSGRTTSSNSASLT